MYEKILFWYTCEPPCWNDEMVQNAADKGVITKEQAEEILNSK